MKIRKKTAITLALSLGLLLSGCGDSGANSHVQSTQNAVESALQKQIAEEEGTQAPPVTTEEKTEKVTEAPTEKPTEKEEKTVASTEGTTTAYTSAAANDRYDPFEGIDTSYISEPDPNVDVDITAMNSDMVYATVLQMLNVPEEYEGKKIKIEGTYYTSYYDVTDQFYHYVIINDAKACCQSGLEFVWGDGSHVFPDEYPTEASEVEVAGVLERYYDEADGMYYIHLKDSTMKVVAEAEQASTEITFQY